jgi:hypothetical protein
MNNINTNKKGVIGLTNVLCDITNKGYFAFLPISDTTEVDLIVADEKMILKKCQVKYRKVNNRGCIEISKESVVNGKRIIINDGNIDFWAVFCPDTSKVYYISKSDFTSKNITIRINTPNIICDTMNLACNFESIDRVFKNS